MDDRRKEVAVLAPVQDDNDRRQYKRVDALGGWQCCNYPASDLCYESIINISEGGASFLVPSIKGKTPTIDDAIDINFILMGIEFNLKSKVIRLSKEYDGTIKYTRSHLMFLEVSDLVKQHLRNVILKVNVLSDLEMTVIGNLVNKSRKHYPFKIVSKNILLKE
jgi:c-di-GMP-binding flagellar brake protein YcgR